MKDSRSVNKAPKSKVETIRDEMEDIIVQNRYGKGPHTKPDLMAFIGKWRSELGDIKTP